MTALFVLAKEYIAAAEKLSEMDMPADAIADTLESISGDLELKATNVAYMIRNLGATIDALKAFEQAQKARREAMERKVEALTDYLARTLEFCGIEKVDGPGVVIKWRKSSGVVINEPGLIPAAYMRQKPAPAAEPDKKAIADAIKAGNEVPGAHLESRKNLVIA